MSARVPPPSSFGSNVFQSSDATQPSSFAIPDSVSAHQSRSAGPRPLHLTLGSVVATSPTPASPSTASNIARVPNDSGTTSTSNADASSGQALNSPQETLPLSPSPTVTNLRKVAKARKRSSISYLPPSPHSPSYLQSNRHDVADGFNLPSSPLSSTHTRTKFLVDGAKLYGSGLARSNSLGGKGSRTPRSATFGERSSTGSILHSDSNFANGVEHLKERPPATLSEKHVDLLHFIAQKESKCLELRSQLAVHEAELVQLKKKWERIVNRGFERALTPNSASPTPSSYFLSSSPSHSTSVLPDSSLPSASSPAYFPTLNPNNSNATGAVMLEGIKEGVQGMSRFIAAGLGSIAQVNAAPQTNEQTTKRSQTPDSATIPVPLRLGPVSHRSVHSGSGHGQKESQSSSSTTASNATSMSFLSVSSATSASSGGGGRSSTTVETTKDLSAGASSTSGLDTESDFGDFEDGQVPLSRTRSSTLTEHLMVQDTGATPMMSPNPHFQRRKFRDMQRDDTTGGIRSKGSLPLSVQEQQPEMDASKEDFDWDDGWDEPAGEAQVADYLASADAVQQQQQPKAATTMSMDLQSSYRDLNSSLRDARASGTEAGSNSPSARSPLSLMDKGVSTPTTQQVNSWVGSVGKKWGEIKGSSTFTKNQKRASVLLSDIQQTLVGSLIPPTPVTSSSTYSTPSTPASTTMFSSNAVPTKSTATAWVGTQVPKVGRGKSLLDDSDDESFGESGEDVNATVRAPLPSKMSAPVLVPDSAPRTTSIAKNIKASESLKPAADEDDWNW